MREIVGIIVGIFATFGLGCWIGFLLGVYVAPPAIGVHKPKEAKNG